MAAGVFVRFGRRVVPVVLVVVAFSAVLWAGGEGARATTFEPQFSATLGDGSPGATSTISFSFGMEAPDAMFHSLVSFAPAEFEFAHDEDVTTGALAGTVKARATLGLVNGACNSSIDVEYQLYEASTDRSNTIPLYTGVEDLNGNGLLENVDRYPSFLTELAPNLQPVQRLYGQVLVSGIWAPLNFVVFEPGAHIPLFPEFDASLGYPIVVTLLDPTAPIEMSSINDFCSPLTTSTELLGVSEDNPATGANEGGAVLHRNPAADGQYVWMSFARSRWDADDDGIENELDPCPYDPDPNWDPRAPFSAGDADQDGLPASCDPNDSSYNSDQDGDTWLNRSDLCPTLATLDLFYMYDADKDGVGDACDRVPDDDSDGGLSHQHVVCKTAVVTVGAGSGEPVLPECPSGPNLPVPPSFTLYPPEWQTGAGNVQSMYISVVRPLGKGPVPGVAVEFEVTGANPTMGECLTDSFGSCQFNYLGPNVGIDTVEASAVVDEVPLTATATIEWVAPPENDDFADAVEISGLPFEDVRTTVGAGVEAGEPTACGLADETVWYRLTPAEDVFVEIMGSRELEWVTLGLYRGESMPGLQPMVCGYPGFSGPPGLAGDVVSSVFPEPETYVYAWLESGETYYVQVGTAAYTPGGDLVLEVKEGSLGDADCDGVLTTNDALRVLLSVAFGVQLGCESAADMNCDGSIAAVDALEMLRRIAGFSAATGCA